MIKSASSAGKTGMRILVIEDEKSVSDFLESTLVLHHHQVRVEATSSSGLQAVIEYRPDVIILDLGLPDQPGIETLKEIRSWSTTPIIILTASDSDQDKVFALDSGADDYLTKPFSVPELMARIRVAFRHALPGGRNKVSQGRVEIDFSGHRAFVDGKPLKLTQTEFDILKVLFKNAGKVVTHRVLLREVWGPNSVEHTQYVRVYVGHLRKKLNLDGSEDLIVTEPGIGYRLVDEVTE